MKSSTLFFSFFAQVSLLIQFLIENCCRIFGEEITSLLGQVSGRCDTRENASGIVNNWIGFCEKQTCALENAGTVSWGLPQLSEGSLRPQSWA